MNCGKCEWKENVLVCRKCQDEENRRRRGGCLDVALPPAHVERPPRHASVEKKKGKGLDSSGGSRVCIHIHSRRNRLCDADGISAKAVIDGLVLAGILADDSPKEVAEVSYSQEQVEGDEETIITISPEEA